MGDDGLRCSSVCMEYMPRHITKLHQVAMPGAEHQAQSKTLVLRMWSLPQVLAPTCQAYACGSVDLEHSRVSNFSMALQMVLDPLSDSDSAAMGAATLWAVVQVLTPLPAVPGPLPVCAHCAVQHMRNVALPILYVWFPGVCIIC